MMIWRDGRNAGVSGMRASILTAVRRVLPARISWIDRSIASACSHRRLRVHAQRRVPGIETLRVLLRACIDLGEEYLRCPTSHCKKGTTVASGIWHLEGVQPQMPHQRMAHPRISAYRTPANRRFRTLHTLAWLTRCLTLPLMSLVNWSVPPPSKLRAAVELWWQVHSSLKTNKRPIGV